MDFIFHPLVIHNSKKMQWTQTKILFCSFEFCLRKNSTDLISGVNDIVMQINGHDAMSAIVQTCFFTSLDEFTM